MGHTSNYLGPKTHCLWRPLRAMATALRGSVILLFRLTEWTTNWQRTEKMPRLCWARWPSTTSFQAGKQSGSPTPTAESSRSVKASSIRRRRHRSWQRPPLPWFLEASDKELSISANDRFHNSSHVAIEVYQPVPL